MMKPNQGPTPKPLLTLRPEILTHPNVPKPLHGLAPREIKGKYWWDKTRKAAYKANNDCCYACGVHKSQAAFKNHMEAHESYTMDYELGSMEIIEIVALCHSCHSFIHSGRLKALMGTKTGTSKVNAKKILEHGMGVLAAAKLEPFYGTAMFYCEMFPYHSHIDFLRSRVEDLREKQEPAKMQQDYKKWHLILDGEKYYSRFKNQDDWSRFYAR